MKTVTCCQNYFMCGSRATKPAFNVGPSSARSETPLLAGWWWPDFSCIWIHSLKKKLEPLWKNFLDPRLTIHNNCSLLSHLSVYLGRPYCKQYGPRSDCSHRVILFASMIKSVCFHDKSCLDCIWYFAVNVICRHVDVKSRSEPSL